MEPSLFGVSGKPTSTVIILLGALICLLEVQFCFSSPLPDPSTQTAAEDPQEGSRQLLEDGNSDLDLPDHRSQYEEEGALTGVMAPEEFLGALQRENRNPSGYLGRALLRRPFQKFHFNKNLRKRTCLFNGGMSHSCDYKDALNARQQSKYWNSMASPGRRRRSVDSQDQDFMANVLSPQ